MRVLLVQPPFDPTTSKLSAIGIPEPLGLEYIAAAIPDHDVRILDLRVEGSIEEAIKDFDPRVVGCTAVTASVKCALALLRAAKKINPEIVTVIGGHHPTLRPGDCQVEPVDVIVRGEGENPLAGLVSCVEAGRSFTAVDGIVHRSDGEWTSNPRGDLVALDEYRFPARALTESMRHAYFRVGLGSILSAVSSRGCTRRCHFCSIWRFHHGKYRRRSPENVVAELASRPELVLDFMDDDSFGDIKAMERLRQLVVDELPGRTFRFFVRSDTVVRSPDLFERWAGAGMKYALVGLESFRDEELRDLNKSATAEQNVKALEILKSVGIGVLGYLIVRPDFTEDDFERLGDTVEELGILQPVFGTLTPFPGTVLFDQMQDRLVTTDWEHFDGFRAVVETALPRPEYYRRLADLYRRTYRGTGPASEGEELPWYETLARAIELIEEE